MLNFQIYLPGQNNCISKNLIAYKWIVNCQYILKIYRCLRKWQWIYQVSMTFSN